MPRSRPIATRTKRGREGEGELKGGEKEGSTGRG